MKKTQVITFAAVILVAIITVCCWTGYEYFSRSYIQEYYFYDGISVRRSLSTSTKKLDIYSNITYRVNFKSEDNDKIVYNNICCENGDTSYNEYVHLPLNEPTIMTEYPQFATFNVYSNKDFDAEHPAGTSLNDVMRISYESLSKFIENGYKTDSTKFEYIEKPLNELNAGDLKLHTNNIFLWFVKEPDVISTHELTFECYNANGEKFTTTYNYDFSLKEGEVEPEVTVTYETL